MRTPGGPPNQCPVCDSMINIEPSFPFGDAACPSCGELLWFTLGNGGLMFHDASTGETKKKRIRELVAKQLGVSPDSLPEDIQELGVLLGGDSLDVVELVMVLEEEFDIYP